MPNNFSVYVIFSLRFISTKKLADFKKILFGFETFFFKNASKKTFHCISASHDSNLNSKFLETRNYHAQFYVLTKLISDSIFYFTTLSPSVGNS